MNPKVLFIFVIIFAIAWSATKNQPTQNSFLNTIYKGKNLSVRPFQKFDETNKYEGSIQTEKTDRKSSLNKNVSLYVYGSRNTDPSKEYVTFTLSPSHKGKVLISGFEIKSGVTGNGTIIPKGVDLPFANQINYESPIFIDPGDKVVLITGRSPTGYSFKLNKCTGYFNQFQDFTPKLPKECPVASDYNIASVPGYLKDACVDYLESIPRCNMPLNNIPPNLQSECLSLINEKLNYKSCVEDHKNDKDFYKKEWRIYLGRSEKLWKDRREIIKLLDLNKETIGTATY